MGDDTGMENGFIGAGAGVMSDVTDSPSSGEGRIMRRNDESKLIKRTCRLRH
jgi:hypothetical protein